jgi:hypothetical protein
MNRTHFMASTLHWVTVGGLLMVVLLVGLGLLCESCVADEQGGSVEGYLATACVYLLCSLWTAGVGSLLRPIGVGWSRFISWALYAVCAIQFLLGVVVAFEGMILAEEPNGEAFFGAGVLWVLSAMSLGLAALVGREAVSTASVD